MMTTIALYNIKGGVGKTAGCANLAYLAAAEGNKVLIWDMDPQGSATFYFQVQPKLKGGFRKILAGDASLDDNIHETEFENLHLIPADFSNRQLDIVFDQTKQGKKKLRSLITSLHGIYDYLFIDCPPGIGPLAEAIFSAADVVLMPTIPTTLSLRTWQMAEAFFEENDLPKDKLMAYFSMVDIRKNLHNEAIGEYHRHKQFLKNYIPYLSTVEKMGSQLSPVAWFAPSSYAAQCFSDLWKELKKRLR